MEESVDIAIRHIQEWAKVIVYLTIAVVAIWIRVKRNRALQNRRKLNTPQAEPVQQQPATTAPKPAAVRPRVQKPAVERKYFTYEDDMGYKSLTEKKTTDKQPITVEEEGSDAIGFDLRTAVIASEILKPKFEE